MTVPGVGFGGGAHLPIIIAVQVATDGQHGAGQALGCRCSKGVWRLVNQTGIREEVEGRGAGTRVEWGHLEAER